MWLLYDYVSVRAGVGRAKIFGGREMIHEIRKKNLQRRLEFKGRELLNIGDFIEERSCERRGAETRVDDGAIFTES